MKVDGSPGVGNITYHKSIVVNTLTIGVFTTTLPSLTKEKNLSSLQERKTKKTYLNVLKTTTIHYLLSSVVTNVNLGSFSTKKLVNLTQS